MARLFLKKLEFNDFVVDDDIDEVDNPPDPAKEDSDKNPNDAHCGVLCIECFDDTVDHPEQVKVEDTENDFHDFG